METKKWTRWQDWVALVAGVVLLLTPLWFDPETNFGIWAMIVLGALIGLGALWSLAAPGMIAAEWALGVLGILTVIAPWVADYAEQNGAAVTSWIVGAIAILVGLEVILESRRSGQRAATT